VSPIFAYVVLFGMWLSVACLVWLAAAVMAIGKRTRSKARCLSLAMALTFPAVFLYQAVGGLIALVIFLAAHLSWKAIEPGSATASSPVVIAVSWAGAISAFAVLFAMSLLGFYEGWRIGWSCGKGCRLREALGLGATARVRNMLFDRLRPIR
jgi:hypothetical protein